MTAWHDAQTIRAEWADARGMSEGEIEALLDATREWCWRFVPASTRLDEIPAGWLDTHSISEPPADVPGRYRIAQRLAFIALAQLARGGTAGDVGLEGYSAKLYAYGFDVQRVLVPPIASNDPTVMIG